MERAILQRTDGTPGKTRAGWGRMSPEQAIFGNLSRKTELMGELSSVDGEATPYHLP